MLYYRSAWAEINLKNLEYNFEVVKKLVGPKVKILVPVKSDAYGHGIIVISKELERLGVDYLGVASIDEGIVLRNAGVAKPILVLNTVPVNYAAPIIEYGLTQTVCTRELAHALNKEARKRRVAAPIHIKVDTGMHRIGVAHRQAYAFIKDMARLSNLNLEGIFTHFPCADSSRRFTLTQIKMFNGLIGKLEKAGIHMPLRHTANSIAVMDYPQSHFNMVRPGLMVYGLRPKEGPGAKLKPLLSLKAKIAYLKTVPKARGIGYGHTFVTAKKMRIATLPIGYGNGYPRSLSNRAHCLIAGKPARIVGRICMDQMMADVTGIKNVAIGDTAVLVGNQKDKSIRVEYLARLAKTIPYEIVCNLGERIGRIYTD